MPVSSPPERNESVPYTSEPGRPDEHEPEHGRHRREREDVPGASVAPLRARARAGPTKSSAPPIQYGERSVDRARQEDEHRDDRDAVVDEALVQELAGLGREQDCRDAREDDDRQDRLLPRLYLPRRLVPERGEDRSRSLEDRQRPQPPALLGALLGSRLHLGVHGLRLTPYQSSSSSSSGGTCGQGRLMRRR